MPTPTTRSSASLRLWNGSLDPSSADIVAGDGKYAFAATQIVGSSGKVFATEIDQDKLAKLHSEVTKRHLTNVIVIESKDADTNLPPIAVTRSSCVAFYHHLTKPANSTRP